jgi:archaemetzincin
MPRVNGGNRSKVLAVSGEDLFIPILTYVFGEAQLGGEFAVVSYHRLQPERYGLAADRNLLLDRLFKESLHELGHTYGLVHCQDQDCVMRTSTYAEDIDLKGGSFCRRCQAALGLARQHP